MGEIDRLARADGTGTLISDNKKKTEEEEEK
jgi:hypothetical protein